MTTGKTIALTRQTYVGKVMSLLFEYTKFFVAFLPRSKCLLISWLQLLSAMTLETKKIKSATASTVSPSIFHEVMGLDAMILVFLMLNFKVAFSLFSFTLINRFSHSSLFSAIKSHMSCISEVVISLAILIPTCDLSSLAFHMMYSA